MPSEESPITAVALALWYVTKMPMLLLIAPVGGYRLFTKDAAQQRDAVGLQQYAGLLVALAAIGVFGRNWRSLKWLRPWPGS